MVYQPNFHQSLARFSAALLWLSAPAFASAQCGISDLASGEPVTVLGDNDYCTNFDVPGLALGLHCGFSVETDRSTDTYVDEDFFLTVMQPGETLRVATFFDTSVADLDLFLYDFLAHDLCNDLFTNLDQSISTSDHEEVSYTHSGSASLIVLIRINAWTGHAGSQDCNLYDILVESSSAGQGQSYCGEHSANSVGTGATLTSMPNGTPGLTDLEVCGLPDLPGILFHGPQQSSFPFGCGTRCVAGAIVRLGVTTASGGSVARTESIPAGANVQYWYRDPSHLGVCGATFNLSNAVQLP